MSRIADTSALYAAFVAEDIHHTDARSALAEATPTIVPSEIFCETLALLQYRIGFDAAARAGAAIRATAHLRVAPATDAIMEAAWEAFLASKGRLSPPDAVVVAWARSEAAAVLTFDKAIRRAVGAKR